MLLSRGLPIIRASRLLQKTPTKALQPIRNSGHDVNYRSSGAPPPKITLILAEAVGGFAWWWVLWHLWTEPGHIFGEFPYPDPRKWTDEELGIPTTE